MHTPGASAPAAHLAGRLLGEAAFWTQPRLEPAGKAARKGAAARHLHPAACNLPCVPRTCTVHATAAAWQVGEPPAAHGSSSPHTRTPSSPGQQHRAAHQGLWRLCATQPRPSQHIPPNTRPATSLPPLTHATHASSIRGMPSTPWVGARAAPRNAGQGSRRSEVWEFPGGVPPVPCIRSHARLLPLQLTPAVRCPDNDPHGQQHRFTPAPLLCHSAQQHYAPGEGTQVQIHDRTPTAPIADSTAPASRLQLHQRWYRLLWAAGC